MISENVMKIEEWKGNLVWYKIACDCGNEDCDCIIAFELDQDFGYINLNFMKKMIWDEYYYDGWFLTRFYRRFKSSLKILFTGRLEMEGEFIIRKEKHIDSIIEALHEGKNKMIDWQNDFREKNKGEKIEN